MEGRTKSYFIRSRCVSAENRYDEYYNCNRTGFVNARASLKPDGTPKSGRGNRTKTSRKIGGLCPANIKLYFNDVRKCFTVNFCTTHVGHEMDAVQPPGGVKRKKGRRLKNHDPGEEEEYGREEDEAEDHETEASSTMINRTNGTTTTTTTIEEVPPGSDEETIAIDSIVLGCSYGCPESPVCEHLKPYQVAEPALPGQSRAQSEMVPGTEVVDLSHLDQNMLETLMASYPTSIGPDGQQIFHIPPEQVPLLAQQAETLHVDPSASTATTSTISEATTMCFLTNPDYECLQTLQGWPQVLDLIRPIVAKLNQGNVTCVRRRLGETLGILDTLELIGSYTKKRPLSEDDD